MILLGSMVAAARLKELIGSAFILIGTPGRISLIGASATKSTTKSSLIR